MDAEKSEAQKLIRKLIFINYRAYQNCRLTHKYEYVLHFEHLMAEDRNNAKLLGIYTSHTGAQRQISRLKSETDSCIMVTIAG